MGTSASTRQGVLHNTSSGMVESMEMLESQSQGARGLERASGTQERRDACEKLQAVVTLQA